MIAFLERIMHHRIPQRVRQHVQLVVYFFLMGLVVYSLAIERAHSDTNRKQLARATKTVLVTGCLSGNDLRVALQNILKGNLAQIESAVGKHLIPADQAAQEVKFLRRSIASIAPRHCTNAYANVE